MSDLISRRMAIQEIRELFAMGESYCDELSIVGMLNGLPSAEPERKKGKWIHGMLYHDFDESEWEKVKCSVCEKFVTKQIFYHDNKYHYCPYCGADMRGE